MFEEASSSGERGQSGGCLSYIARGMSLMTGISFCWYANETAASVFNTHTLSKLLRLAGYCMQKYQRTLPPPASSATVPLPPSLLLPLPTLEVHANDDDPPSPVDRTSSGSKQPLFLELSGSGKVAEQPIWSKAHTGNKSLHGSFTPRLRTSATGAATEAAGPVTDGDKPPGEVLHGRALFLLPPTSRSRQSLCKVGRKPEPRGAGEGSARGGLSVLRSCCTRSCAWLLNSKLVPCFCFQRCVTCCKLCA